MRRAGSRRPFLLPRGRRRTGKRRQAKIDALVAIDLLAEQAIHITERDIMQRMILGDVVQSPVLHPIGDRMHDLMIIEGDRIIRRLVTGFVLPRRGFVPVLDGTLLRLRRRLRSVDDYNRRR